MSELTKANAAWLKTLSSKERIEARQGLDAGRAWGQTGQCYDTLKVVASFAHMVAANFDDDPPGEWGEMHDVAFDYYAEAIQEAVGDDDDAFAKAIAANVVFTAGWSRGICEAFVEIAEAM